MSPPDPYELDRRVSPSARALEALAHRLSGAINPHVRRFVQAKIHWERPSSQAERDEAERFHLAYREQRSRRLGELRAILDRQKASGHAIAMICCQRYLPLFEVWLRSCEQAAIEVRQRCVVFAMDEATAEAVAGAGVEVVLLDPAAYPRGAETRGFADQGFRRVVLYKNAVIHDLLSLGVDVLFQDVDLIWLRDPTARLEGARDAYDLQAMHDGLNPIHAPYFVNSGFMYVSSNERTLALFESALRNTVLILMSGSHQKPLNRIIGLFVQHNLLELELLPEREFPNGHLFDLEHGVRAAAADWRRQAYALHYSWTGDLAVKLRKLELLGWPIG